MELKLELGQVFWLKIPLLAKKQTYTRPFLVYEINDIDYVFLKISSSLKDYIPQFPLTNKPDSFYKEKSFIDSNILVRVKRDLFPHKLNEITGVIEQGQKISLKDLKEIMEIVDSCFSKEELKGNRYEIRVT